MICNHCGKEVEPLKSAIAQLHEQGKSPAEIRDSLEESGRLRGTKSKMINTVHKYIRLLGLIPNFK